MIFSFIFFCPISFVVPPPPFFFFSLFFSPLIPFSPSILVDIILDTGISVRLLIEISHFPFSVA